MKRRRFLAGLGGGCSLGGLWYLVRPPRRSIEVRYWCSERAASYDRLRDRIPPYVETALSPVFEVDVSYGGVVSVRREDGYRVMRSGEWPRRVIGEVASSDEFSAADVNLLVTDGPMYHTPTGAGVPHLASVGGAEHLAEAAPRESFEAVVPYAREPRVMHVLLHEVGHALGLDHEHGSIATASDGTVASPMISTYAWTGGGNERWFDVDRTVCGNPYPSSVGRDGRRYLSFAFSDCARRELEEYRGGVRP